MSSLFSQLGPRVASLVVPTLDAKDDTDIAISGVTPVASYTWLDKATPTMMVPSCPPVWRPRTMPFALQKDSGRSYIDQNAHRMRAYPYQPLFASILHMQPDFPFTEIDVVSDRNNLRKLLRWIKGGDVKDFRIDVELVGSTIFFLRKEEKTIETSGTGYGHGFERAVTTAPPDAAAHTGHHRIIRYTLNGINLLVRFEVDACLPARASTTADSLVSSMAALGLSPNTPAAVTPVTEHGLTIIPSRITTMVEQSRAIELTTVNRKFKNSFKWDEGYFQLLLSQTPNHYLGLHDFGKFVAVEQRTLDGIKRSYGRNMKDDLRRLCAVLRTVQAKVKEQGERVPLSLVCQDGMLELRGRADGKSPVPPHYVPLFTST